jgi:hypothetical protein
MDEVEQLQLDLKCAEAEADADAEIVLDILFDLQFSHYADERGRVLGIEPISEDLAERIMEALDGHEGPEPAILCLSPRPPDQRRNEVVGRWGAGECSVA